MTEGELTPKEVGGFRILRRLASGATSDVLLARAEGPHGFQRVVALKILLARPKDNPEFERGFAAEASAYARLSHPAVVKLYDFFSADGQLVMVLEYVDGVPLHKLRAMLATAGERIDDRAALYLGLRIFSALAAAHGARDTTRGVTAPVIHYDLNPSNILVPWDGQVKVGDFGIAHAAGIQADPRTGFIKGTYGYSAPEQVNGKPLSAAVDVYSAGLVLWELLARRKAVQRGTLNDTQVLKAMAYPEFPALELLRPDLSKDVRAAVRRALEPDPEKRTISAEEMVVVLGQAVSVEDGRKALAGAVTRVKGSAVDAGAAASSPVAARENEGGAPTTPDLAHGQRLDPEETAPFAAVTDESADLGKIAFYGRIMLPAESVPPHRAGASGPPAAEAPGASPDHDPLATTTEGTAEGSDPRPPVAAPPRPVPRPAGEKKPSNFPTSPPGAEPPVATPRPEVALAAPPPPDVAALAALAAAPPAEVAAAIAVAAAPIPAAEPSAPAVAPSTERSPEVPPAQAAEAADPRPRSTPPAAGTNPNAPPYVPSSLPPVPVKRPTPWLVAAVVVLVAAGGIALVSLGGGPDKPVAAAPIPSVPVPSSPPSVAPPASASPPPVASAAPSAAASSPAAPSAASSAASVSAAPAASSAAPVASAAPAVASAAHPTAAAVDGPEPADMGRLDLPASANQHRIFVDGKVAGEGAAPIQLRCGSHLVRIGSAGTEKKIDVPCGGAIRFAP